MSGQELDQLIRERNKLRIELARERIIAERRHKAFQMLWKYDGRNAAAFEEWFWHHYDFETYMRSVPNFAIDPEPAADHARHWEDYLLFVKSWKDSGSEDRFADYLEHLNQRYDLGDHE